MTLEPPRIYRLLRAVVRTALRLFFREIAVEGREHIPTTGGGLLVAWHPNGVIDPGLMLAAFPRQVVFGARDGLLRWPLVGWVMRTLGTVPIYRAQDHAGEGEAARRKANARSLDALAEAVAGGSFSALFPEGQSHNEPHVTDIRSGAARLYLRAKELGAEAPALVPVGLHYDAKSVFRSDVLVVFHPPLEVPPDADVPTLNREIGHALARVVHATDDWDLHRTMLQASTLVRAEAAARDGRRADRAPLAERTADFEQMWQGYHARLGTHPEEIEDLRREVTAYRRALARLGLHDHDLDAPARPSLLRLLWTGTQGVLAYLLLRPLFLIGMVVNAPPYWALKPLARRLARDEKDQATIKMLGGFVLFPLAWIAASLLAVLGLAPLRTLAPWVPDAPVAIGLGAFALSVAGAVVALRSSELAVETSQAVRARWTRWRRPEVVRDLRERRSRLFDRLVALADAESGTLEPRFPERSR
ncbi:MAG: 1-acyl-sn-glycerol-3-phosphate acyltransferase [Bacteroidota bacterium]